MGWICSSDGDACCGGEAQCMYRLDIGTEESQGRESRAQTTRAPDPVNHPPHYTSHPSGIECIQVTRWMNFNLGNATKYIWRAALKGGIEDLQKAIWYLNDEIARLRGESNNVK